MTDKQSFWAIVEIMGRQTYAGLLSEQSIGGAAFVRVDVPSTSAAEAFSKLFGAGSIYAITPVSEQVACLRAEALRAVPLTAWDLPEAVREKLRSSVTALPGPTRRDDMFDDDSEEGLGSVSESGEWEDDPSK